MVGPVCCNVLSMVMYGGAYSVLLYFRTVKRVVIFLACNNVELFFALLWGWIDGEVHTVNS